MEEKRIVRDIAKKVNEQGGVAYYVGGYVRDMLMGIESKDIDVEIHGVEVAKVVDILKGFGTVEEIGKQFGVYMIKGLDVDFSLPRTEIVIGEGHTGFDVTVEPYLGEEKAARRRDFTINAMMENILTGEVYDPFKGKEDIKRGVIRHVNENSFVEDPLRVYRMAQFASRFNFEVEKQTLEMCKSIDVSTLAKERVNEEFKKGLLKSDEPSIFIRLLREVGVIEKVFKEIDDLIGCKQSKEHHPEGDVFTHTMMVLDEAAKQRDKVSEPYAYMLGALFHDIGKPLTVEEHDGKITSHEHDTVGSEIVGTILRRTLTKERDVIRYVTLMVKNHMRPRWLYPNASKKAFRKLAIEMEGNIEDLFLLAEADTLGRGNVKEDEFDVYREFFDEKIESLELKEEIKPVVTGKDLIERGLNPGRSFGKILNDAMELQLDGYSKEDILGKIFKERDV